MSKIKKLAVFLGMATVLLSSVPAAAYDNGLEKQFVRLINAERRHAKLVPLKIKSQFVAVARKHSIRMMQEGEIRHNGNLGYEVAGPRGSYLGENVGVGLSVGSLHEMFMESPKHRVHILEPSFRHIGVGVAVDHNVIFVTEIFGYSGKESAKKSFSIAKPVVQFIETTRVVKMLNAMHALDSEYTYQKPLSRPNELKDSSRKNPHRAIYALIFLIITGMLWTKKLILKKRGL